MKEYTQFYINGEWVEPTSPNSFDVINPANEDVWAHIALGTGDDVDKAVNAAKDAFRSYGVMNRQQRIDILSAVIGVYKERQGDLADAISEEMGAPTKLAIEAQAAAGLGHLIQALEVLNTFEFDNYINTEKMNGRAIFRKYF